MFDIVALGESLIDFTPSGENSQGMALFARNPGGAPANVLAMAAKLGGKTAFIGKVGDDAFGAFFEKDDGGCWCGRARSAYDAGISHDAGLCAADAGGRPKLHVFTASRART